MVHHLSGLAGLASLSALRVQRAGDDAAELFGLERLPQDRDRAEMLGAFEVETFFHPSAAAEHQHRRIGKSAADRRQRLEAVHLWHEQIGDHEIGVALVHMRKRAARVGKADAIVLRARQQRRHVEKVFHIIVDRDDMRARARGHAAKLGPCCAAAKVACGMRIWRKRIGWYGVNPIPWARNHIPESRSSDGRNALFSPLAAMHDGAALCAAVRRILMDASSLSLLVGYTHSAALLIVGLLAYALAKPRVARYPYWVRQLFEVVCFGGLFVLAMLAPLEPIAGIRIDLRTTIVCLAVVFGGPLCGFLVGASGIAIRSMLGSSHPELAIVMVALSYLLSVAYTSWLKKNQRKFDYRDLLPLGVGLDLCRVLAWAVVLGPSFTLHAIDAGWLAMLLLVPFSLFGLGSVVLVVEDRRTLVQAVADSEARFRSILDQLPEGLTLVDLGDRFTYANKAWEAVTGTTAAAALGRTRQEIWAQTANKSVPFPFVQEVREAARPVRTDPVAIKGRNEVRWVAGTLFPVRDSSGAIREIGTTGADVTELVIAREDLARREAMAQRHKNALLEAVNVTRIVDQIGRAS